MTPEEREPPRVIVVMGVSGSGKTTIGRGLAARLGWAFADADQFHPAANIAKMERGLPLDDSDRAPWLAAIAGWIDARLAAREGAVVTCSALRRAYRKRIGTGRPGVVLVHLEGDEALIAQRLAFRVGHFMPAMLLRSQLETLEPPGEDENVLAVSIAPPPDAIIAQIVARLGLTPAVAQSSTA